MAYKHIYNKTKLCPDKFRISPLFVMIKQALFVAYKRKVIWEYKMFSINKVGSKTYNGWWLTYALGSFRLVLDDFSLVWQNETFTSFIIWATLSFILNWGRWLFSFRYLVVNDGWYDLLAAALCCFPKASWKRSILYTRSCAEFQPKI